MAENDQVNHPKHYTETLNEIEEDDNVASPSRYTNNYSGLETIDAIKTVMKSQSEFLGFLKGTMVRYIGRLGAKDDPVLELKKLKQYVEMAIDEFDGKEIEAPIPGWDFHVVTPTGKVIEKEHWAENQHNWYHFDETVLNHRIQDGYPTVGEGNHTYKVHRLVAQAFIPNPENKPKIHHLDGNRMNYNLDNLVWVTDQEHADVDKKMGMRKIVVWGTQTFFGARQLGGYLGKSNQSVTSYINQNRTLCGKPVKYLNDNKYTKEEAQKLVNVWIDADKEE